MLKRVLVALLLLTVGAEAQQAVTTSPVQVYSGDASSTIGVTDTFQTVWSAITTGSSRRGCLLLNNSTHRQWVFFGADSSTPTKAKAIPLEAATAANAQGGYVSCATSAGGVLNDHVWITGTAGDTFVAKQQ